MISDNHQNNKFLLSQFLKLIDIFHLSRVYVKSIKVTVCYREYFMLNIVLYKCQSMRDFML